MPQAVEQHTGKPLTDADVKEDDVLELITEVLRSSHEGAAHAFFFCVNRTFSNQVLSVLLSAQNFALRILRLCF